MPIALPVGLPAHDTLMAEGIDLLSGEELRRWGARPLRLCLVNLMPNKIVTETQIARLLGATPVPVELTLCVPDSYRSKTTPAAHMAAFYRPWSEVRDEAFDGLVVTGAPVETLPFAEVTYWSDLCAIFDWARARGLASFYICWAAQAALHRFHGVPKHPLPQKMFGVFHHRVTDAPSRLLRGFGETFPVPVSRHTELRAADLPPAADLAVLAAAPEAGLCLIEDRAHRAVYMFNHLEYDTGTLRDEFLRDRQAGKPIAIPRNYFPDDDPSRPPANVWLPYAHLLFGNWLSEIHRAACPSVTDEPAIQWALAEPLAAGSDADDHADLLISTTNSLDTLPTALRALADMGLAPRTVKVHRPPGTEQLIELRLDRQQEAAIERVAQRLCELPATAKVAYRTSDGAGGCLMARKVAADPGSNDGAAPSEAA